MRTWVVFSVCILLSLPCSGQQKVSLEIGTVTIWLGMPRQDVVRRCADVGYKQVFSDPQSILLQGGDGLYNTHFVGGKLVYASREWYSSDSDKDAFQSTVAALSYLADEEHPTSCHITHEPLSDPSMSMDRIFINCGQRSFLLATGKVNGKEVSGVTEQIGQMPPKP